MGIFAFLFLLFSHAETLTPVSIAYPAEGTIISAQVGLVFEKTDILKKNGFQAQVRAMGTGRELKTALVSGQADVIITSQTNFVVLRGTGFEGYAIQSMGEAGRLALVVRPDSQIRSIADLKGATVGTIFGTSIHQPLMDWIKMAKLEKEVKIVDVASMAAMQSSLKVGAIDAVMTWDPFLAQGINSGNFRIVREQSFDLITVASKKFANNKDALKRYEKATREALLYMAQNKSTVNTWFSTMSKLDMKSIEDASKLNRNYSVNKVEDIQLAISPDYEQRLEKEAEFLFQVKSIPQKPTLKSHIVR